MGISADSTQKAFASADVDALLARPRSEIPRVLYNEGPQNATKHVLVAVDPSGGGSSAFAVASVVQLSSGGVVVSFTRPNCSPAHISDSTAHASTYSSGV